MSEPFDILPYRSGSANLVEALSLAKALPAEALELAAARPARIAADVLLVVERAAAGTTLSERESNLLFWGVHVLASARDTRLFSPLLRLLSRPLEQWEALLGDAVTATLTRVVASVYDSDAAALMAALVHPEIDEFARWDLFGALSFLTFDGRIDRDETRAFLIRFDEERLARAGDQGWTGWAEAIVLGGFGELSERIAAARQDARMLEDLYDPAWFEATLREAEARPDDPSRFAEQRLGYFGDPLDELEDSLGVGPEDGEGAESVEPAHNPYRDIGRNDPCPCGSGKKFKKCCLAA